MQALGDNFWVTVKDDLRGVGLAWWKENRDDLTSMGTELAQEVFAELRDGEVFQAKVAIAAAMDPAEWRAYKKGTITALGTIARRRVALFEAISQLGSKAAEAVGKAALGAL